MSDKAGNPGRAGFDWCDSPDKDMIMRMFEDRYSLLPAASLMALILKLPATVLAFTPLDPARQANLLINITMKPARLSV